MLSVVCVCGCVSSCVLGGDALSHCCVYIYVYMYILFTYVHCLGVPADLVQLIKERRMDAVRRQSLRRRGVSVFVFVFVCLSVCVLSVCHTHMCICVCLFTFFYVCVCVCMCE